jgi:hypothetical protein
MDGRTPPTAPLKPDLRRNWIAPNSRVSVAF